MDLPYPDPWRQGGVRRIPVVLLAAFALLSCSSTSSVLTPEAEEALEDAFASARRIDGIKSLVVGQQGRLVAERYYNSAGPDSHHDVRSVTKSITSALIGIAIENGYIASVDQTLAEFLVPSVVSDLDDTRAGITIRNLLTMSAGHEWRELSGNSEFNDWIGAPDQIAYVLDKPIVDPPGTRFNYSDGTAHLLSVILTEATGISAADFALRYLFEPLGLEEKAWPVDNRAYNLGGVGLQLTPRDMLALGTLYLNEGRTGDQQVVPSDWVQTSTQAQMSTDGALPYGTSYGYLWWRGSANDVGFYFATGYGGQFILVVPESQLVVVATCEWRFGRAQANEHWSAIINLIVNQIVPALR
jgi:CubicO group peptidase (beta-lactamase class C family)